MQEINEHHEKSINTYSTNLTTQTQDKSIISSMSMFFVVSKEFRMSESYLDQSADIIPVNPVVKSLNLEILGVTGQTTYILHISSHNRVKQSINDNDGLNFRFSLQCIISKC
jgi:hypothetical protein